MRSISILLAFAITAGILFSSCKSEQETPTPGWVYVHPFYLLGTDLGEESQKVTFGLVYVDSLLLGAYSLPAKVPILDAGQHTVTVLPGIEDNGISNAPSLYPFYNGYTDPTVNIEDLETDSIYPNTTYVGDLSIGLKENFETNNICVEDLDLDLATQVAISVDPNDIKWGNRCGKISLNQEHRYIEVGTTIRTTLPKNGTPIYIELDYKNDVPFQVGIEAFDNGSSTNRLYIITLVEQSEWNKIYLNITDLAQTLNSDEYGIVFKTLLSEDKPTGTILLDNIKVLRRTP